MTLLVHLRGVLFDGSSPAGFGFKVVDFGGWGDGVDVRRERYERQGGHGDYDVPVLRGSRTIPMAGYCRSESLRQQRHHRSILTGLLADGDSDTFTVTEADETQWATVRLGDTPTFERQSFTGFADWELTLFAANPRKFGELRSFGPAASVTAFHYGNFPASPVLTIDGTSPGGYTINGPGGRQFVVTQPLAAGHPHTIDMATGVLRVNGVVVFGGIGAARTWSIPPGQQVTMSVTAGSLSAAVLDTFI